jgi:hypothetical protein
MNIKVVNSMRCFNRYSEFLPTISKPICKKCGFCHYCRDFSCFHHDLESSAKVYSENASKIKKTRRTLYVHSEACILFIGNSDNLVSEFK